MGSLLGRGEKLGSQVSEAECYTEGRMAGTCEWELGKHHTASLLKRFNIVCLSSPILLLISYYLMPG